MLRDAKIVIKHQKINIERGKFCDRRRNEGSVRFVERAKGIEVIVSVKINKTLIFRLFARIDSPCDRSSVPDCAVRPYNDLKAVILESADVFLI